MTESRTSAPGRGSEASPLSGIRVLDFTANAAGPYGAWLLGALGAEIVKVEGRARPDATRGLANRPYAHSVFYEDVNGAKRCIDLDMKSPEGPATALELIGQCHAVVDSFRPGVMRRFGLDHAAVHERFPHVVVASLSATGSTGPYAGLPGYAGVFNALGGLGWLTGYADGPPTELRTSVDLRSGAVFAMLIAGALLDAQRTGLGRVIDFSACEAVTLLAGEHVTAALADPSAIFDRLGNRDDHWSPQGVFAAADGRWLALTVRTDAEWSALCALAVDDGVTLPGGLDTVETRRAATDAVEAALAAWTLAHEAPALRARLVAAGVPAEVVLTAPEVAADGHLAANGYFQAVDGLGDVGPQLVASPPWTIGGTRAAAGGPRALGADTETVLAELLVGVRR